MKMLTWLLEHGAFATFTPTQSIAPILVTINWVNEAAIQLLKNHHADINETHIPFSLFEEHYEKYLNHGRLTCDTW